MLAFVPCTSLYGVYQLPRIVVLYYKTAGISIGMGEGLADLYAAWNVKMKGHPNELESKV